MVDRWSPVSLAHRYPWPTRIRLQLTSGTRGQPSFAAAQVAVSPGAQVCASA